MVGGNGDDIGVAIGKALAAGCGAAARLDLLDRCRFIALDDDEIAGAEPADHLGKLRLGRAVELADQRPAPGRDHGDLGSSGAAVACAVGIAVVDLEVVVRVLDRRHLEAAPGELLDQAYDQSGLARLLPAGNADDRHIGGVALHNAALESMERSWSSSCGVLALKKGSMSMPHTCAGGNGTGTVPCRSVQSRTLRTPDESCASRSSASATGHSPITG